MSQLAWIDLATLLYDNSPWRGTDLSIGVAVCAPESDRNPAKVSPPNQDGSVDYGLMQVNSKHLEDGGLLASWTTGQLLDGAENVRAAAVVWKAQGWRAWSAYRAGLHEPFLPQARVAMDARSRIEGLRAARDAALAEVAAAKESLANEVDLVNRLQDKIDAARLALE